MSFVFTTPEYVAAAASDLANIGSTISSANAAALGRTSGVLAAGADEVSTTVAALFDAHAQAYQALSTQAALFHQQFVELMNSGAGQYALTEAANASPLQTVGQAVTSGIGAASQALAEGSPIGNGANGALVTGASGGPGTLGPGANGAAAQLVGWTPGSVGMGPGAAAHGGGSFGAGRAGVTGSVPTGGSVASGPAGQALEGAEEVGISGYGGTPVATVPDSPVTPLAAVPAATAVSPTATARPATPAYSPAAAQPAESADE
jgi:hypothetical protein